MGANSSRNAIEAEAIEAWRPYVIKRKRDAVDSFNDEWDELLKAECRAFFRELDRDNSKSVSMSELIDFAKKRYSRVPEKTWRRLFKFVDVDGNGVLEFDECILLCVMLTDYMVCCDGCGDFIDVDHQDGFVCTTCLNKEEHHHLCIQCYTKDNGASFEYDKKGGFHYFVRMSEAYPPETVMCTCCGLEHDMVSGYIQGTFGDEHVRPVGDASKWLCELCSVEACPCSTKIKWNTDKPKIGKFLEPQRVCGNTCKKATLKRLPKDFIRGSARSRDAAHCRTCKEWLVRGLAPRAPQPPTPHPTHTQQSSASAAPMAASTLASIPGTPSLTPAPLSTRGFEASTSTNSRSGGTPPAAPTPSASTPGAWGTGRTSGEGTSARSPHAFGQPRTSVDGGSTFGQPSSQRPPLPPGAAVGGAGYPAVAATVAAAPAAVTRTTSNSAASVHTLQSPAGPRNSRAARNAAMAAAADEAIRAAEAAGAAGAAAAAAGSPTAAADSAAIAAGDAEPVGTANAIAQAPHARRTRNTRADAEADAHLSAAMVTALATVRSGDATDDEEAVVEAVAALSLGQPAPSLQRVRNSRASGDAAAAAAAAAAATAVVAAAGADADVPDSPAAEAGAAPAEAEAEPVCAAEPVVNSIAYIANSLRRSGASRGRMAVDAAMVAAATAATTSEADGGEGADGGVEVPVPGFASLQRSSATMSLQRSSATISLQRSSGSRISRDAVDESLAAAAAAAAADELAADCSDISTLDTSEIDLVSASLTRSIASSSLQRSDASKIDKAVADVFLVAAPEAACAGEEGASQAVPEAAVSSCLPPSMPSMQRFGASRISHAAVDDTIIAAATAATSGTADAEADQSGSTQLPGGTEASASAAAESSGPATSQAEPAEVPAPAQQYPTLAPAPGSSESASAYPSMATLPSWPQAAGAELNGTPFQFNITPILQQQPTQPSSATHSRNPSGPSVSLPDTALPSDPPSSSSLSYTVTTPGAGPMPLTTRNLARAAQQNSSPTSSISETPSVTSSMNVSIPMGHGQLVVPMGGSGQAPTINIININNTSSAALRGLFGQQLIQQAQSRASNPGATAEDNQVRCYCCMEKHDLVSEVDDTKLPSYLAASDAIPSHILTLPDGRYVCEWCSAYKCGNCGAQGWNESSHRHLLAGWSLPWLCPEGCETVGAGNWEFDRDQLFAQADNLHRQHCRTCRAKLATESLLDRSTVSPQLIMKPSQQGPKVMYRQGSRMAMRTAQGIVQGGNQENCSIM